MIAGGDRRTIVLTRGLVAVVDAADFEALDQHKWCVSANGSQFYAVRAGRLPSGGFGRIYMHRQIMEHPAGKLVDHRDGHGLHNWRLNLRVSDRAGNQRNSRPINRSSRFKGVSAHRASEKWQAHIRAGDVRRYLGIFRDEADAARAYDTAALELHGEFARLNFPAPAQNGALR